MPLQPERVGRYIWRHFPAADSSLPLPTLSFRLDICRPLNCNRRRKELSPICTRNDYTYQTSRSTQGPSSRETSQQQAAVGRSHFKIVVCSIYVEIQITCKSKCHSFLRFLQINLPFSETSPFAATELFCDFGARGVLSDNMVMVA